MSAPRQPPPSMVAAYTLGHAVEMQEFYVDEAADHGPYVFDRTEIDECVAHATQSPSAWHRREGTSGVRGLLARALSEYSAEGQSVVVFGASEPWVECQLLVAGATTITTVEYKAVQYEHPRLRTSVVSTFVADTRLGGSLAGSFDLAVALSAFDHDGLGRYGDPLHADGDLLAMRTAWRALRPGGRLMLSAPIGRDLLVWNLHRRYGRLRLPRLLHGWEELKRFGWDEARLDAPTDHRRRFEPLFVLVRNSSADLELALWEAHSCEEDEEARDS